MDRFWNKVNKTETCWLWTGSKDRGRGKFAINGSKKVLAHRWAYENARGPIPEGLVLDHLCRQPSCVRPDHLEPVTHAENVRRGVHPSRPARGVRKSGRTRNPDGSFTHCPQEHEMVGDNVYIRPSGVRSCRKCQADAQSRRYWAMKHR